MRCKLATPTGAEHMHNGANLFDIRAKTISKKKTIFESFQKRENLFSKIANGLSKIYQKWKINFQKSKIDYQKSKIDDQNVHAYLYNIVTFGIPYSTA